MNQTSIPTNTPEVQPADPNAAARLHDARSGRGWHLRCKAMNYEDAFDAIEESICPQTIGKAEELLSNVAQYLREGKPWRDERFFAALIIDVAHAVIEAGSAMDRERDYATGEVFGEHELVTPEALEKVRVEAQNDGFTKGVKAMERRMEEMQAKHEAERAPRSRKLRKDQELDHATRAEPIKAAESERAVERAATSLSRKLREAPKSRKLRLVGKAPASKRAPVSSKAVRRAS